MQIKPISWSFAVKNALQFLGNIKKINHCYSLIHIKLHVFHCMYVQNCDVIGTAWQNSMYIHTFTTYTSCTVRIYINQIDINEQGAEILNHDVPGCTIKFWCTK